MKYFSLIALLFMIISCSSDDLEYSLDDLEYSLDNLITDDVFLEYTDLTFHHNKKLRENFSLEELVEYENATEEMAMKFIEKFGTTEQEYLSYFKRASTLALDLNDRFSLDKYSQEELLPIFIERHYDIAGAQEYTKGCAWDYGICIGGALGLGYLSSVTCAAATAAIIGSGGASAPISLPIILGCAVVGGSLEIKELNRCGSHYDDCIGK
jgi:hypothetical protein